MAFIITIIAFLGVVIINGFTYVGVDLSSTFPIFNVSLLVIFVMTMILFIKEARRSGSFRRSVNILDAYNKLTKYERWLVSAGGIYVAICFFINMFYMSDGGTGVYEGQYAILDKGTFVRFITEEMFNKYHLIEMRTITSVFMFMGIIAIIGYYRANIVTNCPDHKLP